MLSASIATWVLHLRGSGLYLVVGLLVFLELAVVVGFFVPGEIATVVGGVLVGEHRAVLGVMLLVVIAAAVLGNLAGYEVGRVAGPWLLRHWPLRDRSGVARAERLVARRGGPAVFLARFVAVVRAVMPGIAGMSIMPRSRFLLYSAAGGVVWGTTWVLVGDVARKAYGRVVTDVGLAGGVLLACALAVAVIVFSLRAHRRRV